LEPEFVFNRGSDYDDVFLGDVDIVKGPIVEVRISRDLLSVNSDRKLLFLKVGIGHFKPIQLVIQRLP
jgi:hypothetical protein